MRQPAVTVVGSLNRDIVIRTTRLPSRGETLLAISHMENLGGKGANQAVAAARLGRQVAIVGCVGADDTGQRFVELFARENVDTGHLRVDAHHPTGLALIAVEPSGENRIMVSPGANWRMTPADVSRAADALGAAAVTLLQLEVPLDTVTAAASGASGIVVLNPAPARDLPDELLANVGVLVPNLGELAALAGSEPSDDLDDVRRQADRFPAQEAIVVTLGAQGALLLEKGRPPRHYPAPGVAVVDTTAAGDGFCGALADALARNQSLGAAVEWAVRVAALVVTKPGAIAALPTAAELSSLSRGNRPG